MTSALEDLFALQLARINKVGKKPTGGTKDDTRGSYEYFKQLRKQGVK